MSLKPKELTAKEEGKKCGAKLAKSVCALLNKKPRFKVGDIVYFKPVKFIWAGKISAVIPAEKTKRKIPRYSVFFENWGKGLRYEDELSATEEEARNSVH